MHFITKPRDNSKRSVIQSSKLGKTMKKMRSSKCKCTIPGKISLSARTYNPSERASLYIHGIHVLSTTSVAGDYCKSSCATRLSSRRGHTYYIGIYVRACAHSGISNGRQRGGESPDSQNSLCGRERASGLFVNLIYEGLAGHSLSNMRSIPEIQAAQHCIHTIIYASGIMPHCLQPPRAFVSYI